MIPNLISLFRILIIPFFIWTLKEDKIGVSLIIFSSAVVSDFIDGFLARRIPQKNPVGSLLDPLADKFLLMTAFFCLYAFKNLQLNIPFWVLLVVVSRDLIILLGTGLIFVMGTKIEVKPTVWGKMTTFFQMFTIISVLLKFHFSFVFWNVAVIFTIISGVHYISKGIRIINIQSRNGLNR